jgi:hypothetical protein
MTSHNSQTDVLRCSFCNKSQRAVATLIAGPAVHICNECVDICNDIIAGDKDANAGLDTVSPAEGPLKALVRCRLCQLPFPHDSCVAFPDRGWVCLSCLDSVRLFLESAERPNP